MARYRDPGDTDATPGGDIPLDAAGGWACPHEAPDPACPLQANDQPVRCPLCWTLWYVYVDGPSGKQYAKAITLDGDA